MYNIGILQIILLIPVCSIFLYGYYYTYKLAKRYNRNAWLWFFFYFISGANATILLAIIGKKQ